MRVIARPPAPQYDWRPLALDQALGSGWEGATGVLDGDPTQIVANNGTPAIYAALDVGVGEVGSVPSASVYRRWTPRASDGSPLTLGTFTGLALYLTLAVEDDSCDPWALIGVADSNGLLTDANTLCLGGGRRVESGVGRLVATTRTSQTSTGVTATDVYLVWPPFAASLGGIQAAAVSAAGETEAVLSKVETDTNDEDIVVWLGIGGKAAGTGLLGIVGWYAPLDLGAGGFPDVG